MKAPSPPQRWVVDGWRRECNLACDRCGTQATFTIYSDRMRDDEWCEAALQETMQASGWRSSVNVDYSPDCVAAAT